MPLCPYYGIFGAQNRQNDDKPPNLAAMAITLLFAKLSKNQSGLKTIKIKKNLEI